MAEVVRTVAGGVCVLLVVGVVVGSVLASARRLAAHDRAMRAATEAGRRGHRRRPSP